MALPPHLELRIVTPERSLVTDHVDEVELPGSEGYFGVLPGHTPMLASLGVGELWYRKGQEKFYLSVAFGFAEVLADRVTVLARIAERGQEIDSERAEAARKRAEERLAELKGQGPQRGELDYDRARVALMKSVARLQVAHRIPVGARVGELKRARDSVRG